MEMIFKIILNQDFEELTAYFNETNILLKDVINSRDKKSGYTPLMSALTGKEKRIVELLIENGANVNVEDKQGRSPLHLACTFNNLDYCKILIANGANIHKIDEHGNQPLWNATHNAVYEGGDVEIIKLLIKMGADPSHGIDSGITPLSFARDFGSKEIFELLSKKF